MRYWFACVGALALLASVSASSAFAQGRLIAVDSSRAIFEIDQATGAKTQIGTVSLNAGTTAGLAYDPVNNITYVTSSSNDSLFTLDLNTFAATLVGPYGDPTVVMHGLEYDTSTGTLYGASTGNVYTINKTTGQATIVGPHGQNTTGFLNLGYNSDTDVMYGTHTSTDEFFSVNRATGLATLIGALGGPTNPHGLAYNPDNDTMYLADPGTDNLFTINLATGAATLVGSTGTGNLLGLMYVPVIPEPAALALASLAGAAALLRRR